MLKLGLLELGAVREGRSAEETFNAAVEIACYADRLGFHRIWFAEHGGPVVAWRNALDVVAAVARKTTSIRVGSGGVILPDHDIGEMIRTAAGLDSEFPGRIELGVVRSQFPDPEDKFPAQVACVVKTMKTQGGGGRMPPIWLMGIGGASLQIAKKHSLSYCYSLFHKIEYGEHNDFYYLQRYRALLKASRARPPHFSVAISGVCTENQEQLAETLRAIDYFSTVDGPPSHWARTLKKMTEDFGCEEFVILDYALRFEDRLRTLDLLSKIM